MFELKRKVTVVTDSTSSLTPVMGEEYTAFTSCRNTSCLEIRPTTHDGVNLDAETFYRLLRNSKKLPTTSPKR